MPRSCRLAVRLLEGRALPATFTVLNLSDTGPDSLRDCITKANASAGADTIVFDPAVMGTITLTSGELAVSDAVTILGPASPKLTVSGNNKSRIFNLRPAPAATDVAMSGLTLTAGKPANNESGGAIVADDERLTLTNCVLSGNDLASFGSGGAVFSNAGLNLTATGCSFTGNVAALGGAIFVTGSGAKSVLQSCTVSGNKAGSGAGLYVSGYLAVNGSTIAGNSGTVSGSQGAVALRGTFAPGAATIRNSTVSGNTTKAFASAIWLSVFDGNLLIQNSTVTGNANGGVFHQGGTGTLELSSSIIAQNGTYEVFNFGVAPVKANNSLIGISNSTGLTIVGSNNQTGTTAKPLDPLLAPLADNGGPTLTHLPLPGSPVIDAGSNPAGLLLDQRGPGFPRSFAQTDIGAVEAFSILVTNVADSGPGSLRQAVGHANARIGPDTITFDPALFKLIARTITLTTGEIAISDAVTITGPGVGALTISGNLTSRVFDIQPAPAGTGVNISGIGFKDGRALFGGAIAGIAPNLTLTNCTFSNNMVAEIFGNGGAVHLSSGTLTAVACTFSGNSAPIGGAIYADSLTLTSCTVSGNSAFFGAGLYAAGTATTIERCTFSGNQAGTVGTQGIGGAICFAAAGFYTIRNSTISGNAAQDGGGGIACASFLNHSLSIQNCTITANTSTTGPGGIFAIPSTALQLVSSVVAQNLSFNLPSLPDVEFSGQGVNVVFAANSLIGIADGGNFHLSGSGNQTGTLTAPLDAKLGPLANNGGPTLTHAPLPGSPVIDAGNNQANLATDQRGFTRVVGTAADIGAVEVQASAKVTSVTPNGGGAQRSRVTSLVVTFELPLLFSGAPVDAFLLKRQSDNAAVPLAAAVNAVGTVVTLTFTPGPAVEFGSLADGRYTLTVLASKATNLDGNGDGAPGDDFVLVGTPANGLFRLFGDADGDGDVDAPDFGAFRGAFGGVSNPAFDFDGDGDVDAQDFGQFRGRFGTAI